MRRAALSLIILIQAFISNGQLTFQKIYSKPGYLSQNLDLIKTSDGGYCASGLLFAIPPATNNKPDGHLTRLDSTGTVLWSFTYGDSLSSEIIRNIYQQSDGGFIMMGNMGYPMPMPNASVHPFVMRTDSSGSLLWRKDYSPGSSETWPLYSSCITSDGGVAFAGDYYVYSPPYISRASFSKIDSAGTLLWSKLYSLPGNSLIYSVAQTSDNGFIMAGACDTSAWGIGFNYQATLFRTDSAGNLLWAKIYGEIMLQTPMFVKQTADSGFVFSANRFVPFYNKDILLHRTDPSGNLIWAKTINGPATDEVVSFDILPDSNFLLTGSRMDTAFSQPYTFIAKMDTSGSMIWARRYGTNNQGWPYKIKCLDENSYMIAAGSLSPNTGYEEGWIIRTDTAGISGCNETIISVPLNNYSAMVLPVQFSDSSLSGTINESTQIGNGLQDSTLCLVTSLINSAVDPVNLHVYPNPFHNELVLDGTKQGGMIYLYDVTGKLLLAQNSLENHNLIPTGKLPCGLYILNYVERQQATKLKLVKFQ